jgi:hypothetical protein
MQSDGSPQCPRRDHSRLAEQPVQSICRAECEEFRDFVKDACRDWERNRCVYEPEILMNKCHDEYNRLLLLSRWGVRTKRSTSSSSAQKSNTSRQPTRRYRSFQKVPANPQINLVENGNGRWTHLTREYLGYKFWTMHSLSNCTLIHPEKKHTSTPPGKKTTPAKKLTFAEDAITAMEEEDQEEGQGESEREE